MKIAISSDNHFDVNRVKIDEMIYRQAEYLNQKQVTYYFVTGDLFNDFEETVLYVEQLQNELGKNCQVYFIAGNHDMLNGVTYSELEDPNLNSHYLHHRRLDIPKSKITIVGNNGWYDYSFADQLTHKSPVELQRWKQIYWVDQKIDYASDDLERMALVLNQTKFDLEAAKRANRQVIFLTHFVPHRNYIFDQLDHPRWQVINAYLGSQNMGDLLEKYRVRYVAFGHLHSRSQPATINNVTYIHRPLGYGIRRLLEWRQPDFFTEWCQTLTYLEV